MKITAQKYLVKLRNKPSSYWQQRGKKKALMLFRDMAQNVPAYKKYLAKHSFTSENVRTARDFSNVPLMDKDTYLRQYNRKDLTWNGSFGKGHWVVSTTSGSTGEPFYFPRQEDQDDMYTLMAELYLRTHFNIHKHKTLYIVGFPMGAWIGGLFTYEAIRRVALRGGYDLSIITPGISKEEIIKAVKTLGPDFDQVIIGSYGPFLKDTIDDGTRQGIEWEKYNIKCIFSAEGFTEKFRDYIYKRLGTKDPYTGSLNHYGTVDLGTMSYETPLCIYIRKKALESKTLYKKLFGDIRKLPTLTQYDPTQFYFEDLNGDIVCSARSGIPLVRYDLKDRGGIIEYDDMLSLFIEEGIDLEKDMKELKLGHTLWRLPFVHVYERKDFSVSFHAFQIYPETIRKALQEDELENMVTGKFTMAVRFDKGQNQFFEVNAELKAGVRPSKKVSSAIQQCVLNRLLQESSEYRETYRMKGEKVLPHIELWKYEDPTYFKPGTKQKWVLK